MSNYIEDIKELIKESARKSRGFDVSIILADDKVKELPEVASEGAIDVTISKKEIGGYLK